MTPNLFSILTIICLYFCSAAPAHAAPSQTTNTRRGKIFSLDDTQYTKQLFSYERIEIKEANTLKVVTKFKELDGKTNCEETLSYENNELKKYVYNQVAVGDLGEAEFREGKIFYHFHSGTTDKTDHEDLEPNTLVSDMIESFLQKNWDLLEKEETLKIRYVLVERLDTIGFKFFKVKDILYEGKNAILVRMKPTSIFIAALAPSIELVMQKDAPHKLLETRGRLAIRVPEIPKPQSRKDWHAIDAILKLL